ncbi:MAG: aspartate aminotransferase family protein [Alphaproteobacteria bacterium]|nr:aspartate aminotransferase family protein [Alphaproteobacteria bacterium]
MLNRTAETIANHLPAGPYAGGMPDAAARTMAAPILPQTACSPEQVLAGLGAVVAGSVGIWHPHVTAHLHCPVLLPALAAEVAIAALNASMDSFDQAPAATLVENRLCEWLCDRAGFGARSGATFTSGATQSNFMGLLLARDAFSASYWDHPTRLKGLHPESRRLRILCSTDAHFSIAKAAFQLGLAADAVVPVGGDTDRRMRPEALSQTITDLRQLGCLPFVVVATAGTTDFGAIDPLREIAAIAQREGMWLHVDAAYGGALLLSGCYRDRLVGIGLADSVAIDFHKAFLQPVSCGAFLVADAAYFKLIEVVADYLNPDPEPGDEAFSHLVNRSLMTTRRFDALKLWMSLQWLGERGYAELIDRPIDLAREAAAMLAADPAFTLLAEPQLGCVVFRLANVDDRVNREVPRRLFQEGRAVLGHTRIDGRYCLKLTLINPLTRIEDIAALLAMIVTCRDEIAALTPR